MAKEQGSRAGQVEFGGYAGPPPQYEGTTVQSLYIPMRDGIGLATEVVLPGNLPSHAQIPALLTQTRYWRASELRAPFKWFLDADSLDPHFRDFRPFFTSHGYALVVVDVRGTGASFGTWPYPWAEESIEDAREIVDWIVSQPWSDGQVGAHGISYVGTTAELLTTLNHPAVKAVIPMFNHPDAFTDIAFPGGILDERFMDAWGRFDQILDQNTVPQEFGAVARLVLKGVKPVEADKDGSLLQEAVRDHEANGSAYALALEIGCRDDCPEGKDLCVDDVTVHRFREKVMQSRTVTCGWASWMDAGTADAAIRRFLTFENAQRVVIGAWEHGGRFNASPYRPPDAPASPTLPGQWREMLRFFDAHLKSVDNGAADQKTLHYYTMGEETWKRTPIWPPEGTTFRRWYLAGSQRLSQDKPDTEIGADTYAIDFKATTGEYNRWWEMGVIEDKTVMYGDRAEADQRLLTYTSRPLSEEVEIAGYPVVTLYVTSTEEDGAFYVYLEDVDEEGLVTYITEGQLRAIHRKVSTEPAPYRLQVPYHSFKRSDVMPLIPGEVAELKFGLLPTSVLVKRGHRIRVAIAGHDEGTFARIPETGTPTITMATNSVHASCIDLPIVPRR